MTVKIKLGRPPKAAAEKQSERLMVNCTPAQRKAPESAAGQRSFSAWALAILLRRANGKP